MQLDRRGFLGGGFAVGDRRGLDCGCCYDQRFGFGPGFVRPLGQCLGFRLGLGRHRGSFDQGLRLGYWFRFNPDRLWLGRDESRLMRHGLGCRFRFGRNRLSFDVRVFNNRFGGDRFSREWWGLDVRHVFGNWFRFCRSRCSFDVRMFDGDRFRLGRDSYCFAVGDMSGNWFGFSRFRYSFDVRMFDGDRFKLSRNRCGFDGCHGFGYWFRFCCFRCRLDVGTFDGDRFTLSRDGCGFDVSNGFGYRFRFGRHRHRFDVPVFGNWFRCDNGGCGFHGSILTIRNLFRFDGDPFRLSRNSFDVGHELDYWFQLDRRARHRCSFDRGDWFVYWFWLDGDRRSFSVRRVFDYRLGGGRFWLSRCCFEVRNRFDYWFRLAGNDRRGFYVRSRFQLFDCGYRSYRSVFGLGDRRGGGGRL